MTRFFKLAAATATLLTTQACIPASVPIRSANGEALMVRFYPGGETLLDLLIINDVNYFGKAQYQFDDNLGDIGFRFETGERVRAECIEAGKDILGQDQCLMYKVFWSDFGLFPVGTIAPNPII